ncbi:MAG: trypsin-like peptidase domain-containing protein [Candidatus Brocadiaceae bacterium]|nr:trypsin-like peptidase domain-containing protein [Candidatus Brocadiaceae bacterium]
MKYLLSVVLILSVAFFSLFHTPRTNICYGDNPPSTAVDNVYSSVVLISHKKIKTSVWDALRFTAFVAGQVAGTGSFGVGSLTPVHSERSIGTGFQTRWGVVTNSHVIENKSKAVLTTFHKSTYHLKNMDRVTRKDKHLPLKDAGIIQATTKEATAYDWGGMGIDLALIHVKIPGAFALPLAKEVKAGEKVYSLGHPEERKFTPAIGSINHIYERDGIKHIELFIKNAPGSSGSPVLNMKGEVVGIIRGSFKELDAAEAVHVDELREVLGLPINDMSENGHLSALKPWSGAVYSTSYSRLFHRPDCNELIISPDELIELPSKKDAKANGGVACPKCNP